MASPRNMWLAGVSRFGSLLGTVRLAAPPSTQWIANALFTAIDESGWWLGALFGLVHGLFAGTALVNLLLPLVHPRMATDLTAAPAVARLERPGFMMVNYGLRTPLVSLTAHIAYGALVGGFVSLAG